jgi:hypothetical protein
MRRVLDCTKLVRTEHWYKTVCGWFLNAHYSVLCVGFYADYKMTLTFILRLDSSYTYTYLLTYLLSSLLMHLLPAQ